MKKIFIGKMTCNDKDLWATGEINENELGQLLEDAFYNTSFRLCEVRIVKGRIAEKYYLQCKELGYTGSFFENETLIAWCRLYADMCDAVYIPFSGEIFLIPQNVCDIKQATELSEISYPLFRKENFLYYRKFSIDTIRIRGKMLWKREAAILRAQADIVKTVKDGAEKLCLEKPPMHFLYNEYKHE